MEQDDARQAPEINAQRGRPPFSLGRRLLGVLLDGVIWSGVAHYPTAEGLSYLRLPHYQPRAGEALYADCS